MTTARQYKYKLITNKYESLLKIQYKEKELKGKMKYD